MFWVVQENLSNEIGFERLIQTLNRRSLPFEIVKLIPFSHELVPEPSIPEGPVIVSGSTSLSKVATERGWQPGAFINQNFDFAVWKDKYKGLLLNEDATIQKLGRLAPKEPVFVRPCSDDKTFAGFVIEPEKLRAWQKEILEVSDAYATLTPETLVLSARAKPILREFRFFIVEGQVITGSLYKGDGHRRYSRNCDDAAWTLARGPGRQPDRAFVMDVAMTSAGPKVIEINCLSSAGFYEADVDRLVDALERSFG